MNTRERLQARLWAVARMRALQPDSQFLKATWLKLKAQYLAIDVDLESTVIMVPCISC